MSGPLPAVRTPGPTGSPRAIGLALATGGLLVVLDTTVTIVAVPRIVADLDATLPTVQWITTAYLLAIVAVLPLAGWAANTYGPRRVYLGALALFTGASLLAALSWSIGALIAFRVLQGLGGGLLNPVGQAIGLHSVGRDSRGRMMALLGLPVVIGPVLGPPLSGWLVDTASWRWIFAVNLPVGLAALAWCSRVVPRSESRPESRPAGGAGRVDLPGLLLLPVGGVLLVMAAAQVGQSGRVTPTVLALLLAAVLLLARFVRRALTTSSPLLDLRLLRHRPLAGGSAVLAAFGAAYFGGMSLLPVVVQGVRGDSALQAGLLTVPQAVATGLVLQVATRLVDRTDPRRIVVVGVAVGLLGAALVGAAVSTQAPYPVLALAGMVLGVGSGATLLPAMTIATRDLEGARTPDGTTLVGLAQQLASALGTAVVASALTIAVSAAAPTLGGGGLEAMLDLDATGRDRLGADLAQAVGATYGVVALLMLLALACALLALPRGRQAPA